VYSFKVYGLIFHCENSANVELPGIPGGVEVSAGINLPSFVSGGGVVDPLELPDNSLYSTDIDITIDR
jgi:hypothetical protein